jgi:hypothetical protein
MPAKRSFIEYVEYNILCLIYLYASRNSFKIFKEMGERKNVMDLLEFYSPKKDYAADETTG